MVRLTLLELQRLKDRLVVLVFVLKHHPEDEALIEKGILACEVEGDESLQHRFADTGHILEAPLDTRQRQLWPGLSGILDRVVHSAKTLGAIQRASETLDEPHLLEVRDVAQIPQDGTHEWVMLEA